MSCACKTAPRVRTVIGSDGQSFNFNGGEEFVVVPINGNVTLSFTGVASTVTVDIPTVFQMPPESSALNVVPAGANSAATVIWPAYKARGLL